MRVFNAILIFATGLAAPSLAQSPDTAISTTLTTTEMVTKGAEAYPGNFKEALKWYRMAADRGDATAEVALGQMYENGNGVPEDMGQAMIWFQKAADQNNAQAQVNIGILYLAGWGVKRDFQQALIWYRKAANNGDPIAAELLGNAYWNGNGVPADFDQARFWWDKAIAGNDTSPIPLLCGAYEVKWVRIASSNDIKAMDDAISKIDPNCIDLINAAKKRREDAMHEHP